LGDPAALPQLRAVVSDSSEDTAWRRGALHSLVAVRPVWLPEQLLLLLSAPEVAEPAVRALVAWESPAIAPALLAGYSGFNRTMRAAAIDTLVARPATARPLLEAIASGRIPKSDLSRVQTRQLVTAKDTAVREQAEYLLGSMNPTSGVLKSRILKLKMTLKDPAYMKTADVGAGHGTFTQRCAVCHTLFDQGGKIGPDLTGSGRKDLDYLLTNIVDPNASISAEWRLAFATLTDGQTISGSVVAEYDTTIVLQTPGGPITLERAKIRSLERSATSLMSVGLTDDLTVDRVRDLFAFLMADGG